MLALATEDGPRIALLPLSVSAATTVAVVALTILLLVRATRRWPPILLLILVLLPWLPVPVPAAFFMWAGPLGVLVWLTVAWLLAADWLRESAIARRCLAFATSRPRMAAGMLSMAIAGTAAIVAAPSVPGGDEPHYLVITQSLLRDGDLKIENNHRRGDYQQYYGGPLRPDFRQRGRDGEIYSIHAPGISAFVAPAFALGGYRGVVVFLVAIAAIGGALLWHVGWLATRDVSSQLPAASFQRPTSDTPLPAGRFPSVACEASAAWFGWAAIACSSTWIFHSFTVFPEGVGGVISLTGIWALLRAREEQATGETRVRPWVFHGMALAFLPWLHTRFVVLAGSLGAVILLRLSSTRNPAGKAVAFLSIPALSALGWIGYFIAIYGTPDPAAPYGSAGEFSAAFIPGGLAGLLFDQRFGLIANAPVLACAAFGFAALITGRGSGANGTRTIRDRRLAAEVLLVVSTYLLTVTNYAMWWGGWGAPARFAAAALPVLVIPLAAAWASFSTRSARLLSMTALGLTAFISGVLVIVSRGRLAFNTREAYALWLDWASPIADLGQGMPAWFRDREPEFFRDIIVWVIALTAAGLAIRILGKRGSQSGSWFQTATIAILAVVAMAAVTVTWTLQGVSGTTAAPAQLQWLRLAAADDRMMAISLDPLARVSQEDAVRLLRIAPAARYVTTGGAGRDDRPLLVLPAVPAGTYRIRPRTRGTGGLLLVGIGQDQFALIIEPLATPPRPLQITFPVDVRALIVRGDEDARRSVGEITIEPVTILRPDQKVSDARARRAVRYDTASVFFLDERSFPEPGAFWIGGARQSSVVIQPDPMRTRVRLFLRNAPVQNHIALQAGAWHTNLELGPGEERPIEIPLDPSFGAVMVSFTVSSGFRPSEVEPGSRDERFLGVWVQTR